MQVSASDKEISVSEVISQIPFAPFSFFVNDLSRPLMLNNIQPAPEAILAGNSKLLQCVNKETVPIGKIHELLKVTPFDQSKILLNESPVKEITHEFDDFMVAILEECFEHETPVYRAQESNQPQLPQFTAMTIPEPPLMKPATAANKVKLLVGASSVDAVVAFNRLIEAESFVTPLCFDCHDDLSLMGRVLRTFTSMTTPPRCSDIPLLDASLVCDTFGQFIRDYLECLQEQRIEADPAKALYCMCLIAFCNVYRRMAMSEGLSLQNIPYTPFDDFMAIERVAHASAAADGANNNDHSEFELVCSAAIDSYTRLPPNETDTSAQVNHLIELFFAFDSSIQLKRACISGLVTAFPLFSGVFSIFILEQAMNRCLQSGSPSVNRSTAALLLSVLQVSPALSGHLNFILNYIWKGDGSELPKGASLFATFFEESLNCAFNPKFPASSFICNHCCLQMFHALLKGDDTTSAKGAFLLKLRFLDQLTTAATTLSGNSGEVGSCRGLMAAMESCMSVLLTESAHPSSADVLKKIPERVTGLLVKLISGDAAQLRSKAIKNLYILMNSPVLDSSNGTALKQSILSRLSDPSISVRDAVLEFVSKLLLDSRGPVSDEVLSSVLSRIKDRGLSVRKRACKIIGELLAKGEGTLALNSAQRICCLAALLSHWPEEEDESLQDAQFKALRDQWLMPCKTAGNCRAFADELAALLQSPLAVVSSLQDFISKVVVVVSSPSSATASYEVELNSFLAETVNALLENLLRGLETNASSDDSNIPSSNETVKNALNTITVLACQPGYLLDHLALLHTLLRSEDVGVSFASLRLFHIVLPAASFAQLKKLESADLERDLLAFIYRGSENAVKLAIECLYLFVNNCSHQYATLSALWTRFSEYLKLKQAELERCEDDHDASGEGSITNNTATNNPANMARALVALGVLGAQSAFHAERELGVRETHSTPQMRSLLQIIQFFCTVPWPFVRTCALSALCCLLEPCPQLAACWSPFGDLMGSFLIGSLADDASRSKILALLSSILSTSNGNSPNGADRSILKMEGKESFQAALIQSLVPQLCQLSTASNYSANAPSFAIKAQALKLASSAAVLGFVNPHHILPFVCVGMASEDDHLQAFSQASFDRLLGRFPSLAPRDLLQIGKLIYAQAQSPHARGFVNTTCILTAKPMSQSLLSSLYTCLRSSMNSKKSMRFDLLAGVFGFFERLLSGTDTVQEEADPKFVAFLVELIVTLPFQTSDEVSMLLLKIQSLFPLAEECRAGASLLDCTFVCLHGLSAALSFLLRSFPSLNPASLQEDPSLATTTATSGSNSTGSSRSLTRVPLMFTWKRPDLPASPEALEELISGQIPVSELLMKISSAASSQRAKKQRDMIDADEDVDDEEVEMQLESEDDCESEDGGASSEEFEAMLMEHESQKQQGGTAKPNKKESSAIAKAKKSAKAKKTFKATHSNSKKQSAAKKVLNKSKP